MFVIEDIAHPLEGLMQISREPARIALPHLGQWRRCEAAVSRSSTRFPAARQAPALQRSNIWQPINSFARCPSNPGL